MIDYSCDSSLRTMVGTDDSRYRLYTTSLLLNSNKCFIVYIYYSSSAKKFEACCCTAINIPGKKKMERSDLKGCGQID